MHSSRCTPALRWMVLVALLLGTLLSSIGLLSSHGLAAIPVAQQADGHPHSHDDDMGSAVVAHGDGLGHAHHGADHSHEKAHALPAAWPAAAPPLAGWRGMVRPWIERVATPPLERPPMS